MSFMSAYAKCIAENESDISVRKGITRFEKQKSEAQGDFSELEKGTETIANVDNDSEDGSEKREKWSKIRKSGNNESRKENKKVEKSKFNLNLNLSSGKMNERIKTTFSVSSREDISNQFTINFDDFRHWDIVTAQKNFQKNFQIANALKNMFPNPFELTKIPEFNKSKISMYFEKIVTVDVTLPDVVTSESNTSKMFHSTRVTKIFETDYDKNSRQMDSWALNPTANIKNRRAKTSEGLRSPSNIPDDLTINGTSSIYKSSGSSGRNASLSKQSSCEKIRGQERSNCFKFGRTRTSKKSRQHIIGYDLGKLQLLTVTESEDSTKDVKESEMVQILDELSHKHKINQSGVKNRNASDGRDRKILTKGKSKSKKVKTLTPGDCSKIVSENNNKEENLKICKESNSKKSEIEVSRSEEKVSRVDDMEMVKACEKIDEVLRFMSECLLKLANDDVSVGGNSMTETDYLKRLRDDTRENRALESSEDLPAAEHLEIPENSLPSTSSRRHSTFPINQSNSASHVVQFDQNVHHDPHETHTVYPDSREINNNNAVHIVEIQSELGGHAEEQPRHQTQSPARGIRLSKSVLRLSVKIKKSNTDTHKVLRNALEREEKLLNGSPTRSTFIQNSIEMQTEESQPPCSSLIDGLKGKNPHVVASLNSLPRKIKSSNVTGFSFCPRTTCLDKVLTPAIQSLSYYQELHLEELKMNEVRMVTQHASKVGILFIMYRSTVTHITTSIGVLFVMETFRMEDEVLLKSSENCVVRKFRSIKKSFHVTPSTPPITIHCVVESFKKIDLPSKLHEQIEALEEAVEQTEKVYFPEQNSNTSNAISGSNTSNKNETCRGYNHECNEERVKGKIRELLLRTYHLQQKLQRQLQILTEPVSASPSSIKQETFSDFGVAYRNLEEFRKIEMPSEEWLLQTTQTSNKDVQKIDCSTSYEPPQMENFEDTQNQYMDYGDDDDDRSSIDSFKSSNNFSECEKEFTLHQIEENSKQIKYLKNMCNEIELFRKRMPSKKRGKRETEMESVDLSQTSGSLESSSKLLKTVFRGKESMTELSLGLKAVPLTKFNNISVEKRKISENHTKISICISKENQKALSQKVTGSNETMNDRLSCYLKGIRTSTSSDGGHYSGVENNTSTSETDDEDDFKSVASTLSGPSSETNVAEEAKEVKRIEIVSPKSLTKHRFDFYKKMDTSNKIRQKSMSNTSCTYKEFEPLKQALTEMQLRMRSIKRDSFFDGNDCYQKALKLAKMSGGYCQNCGCNNVLSQDTFGCNNTMLPRNQSHCHRSLHLKPVPPLSAHYSISDQLRDIDLQRSSSYWLKSSRSIMPNPVYDFPMY